MRIRDYEVSIWTLQDSFITVLKPYGIDVKGQIQEPSMELKDDGTEEFNFSIPMYLYSNVDLLAGHQASERKENPLWYNVINGNLLANMRKIKVIFNKHEEDEKVFEFLILKTTERHEQDQLYCDISCEGLIFHELGKVGYKISLSQETFELDYEEWAKDVDNPYDENSKYIANIQYWLDQFLVALPANLDIDSNITNIENYININGQNVVSECIAQLTSIESILAARKINNVAAAKEWKEKVTTLKTNIANAATAGEKINLIKTFLNEYKKYQQLNPNQWYYEIDMDYSYYPGYGYETDKLYEDKYVSAWETSSDGKKLVASAVEMFREKARTDIDVSESNIYNITQQIAEKFGIFCRYEYRYDKNYHIISKHIIFYNNFIQEKTGLLDLSYPYATTEVKREMDSTDQITKMFVQFVDDDASLEGQITIMDVDANKSGEDYLLNFAYMKNIGAISQEQYNDILKFENDMHILNKKINNYSLQIQYWTSKIPKLEATVDTKEAAIALDQEGLNDAKAELLAIGSADGSVNSTITLTAATCDTMVLTNYGKTKRQGSFKEKGVKINSKFKLYKTLNTNNTTLGNKLNAAGYTIQYDSNNFAKKVIFTVKENTTGYIDSNTAVVYAVYQYSPQTEYNKIKDLYEKKLAKDIKARDNAAAELSKTQTKITATQELLNACLEEKKVLIKNFELMMGPALREGYWSPEDYLDKGNKYTDKLTVNISAENTAAAATIGSSPYASFIWDTKIFDDEQLNYYYIGINEVKSYYPYVELTQSDLNWLKTRLHKNLCVCFYDLDKVYSSLSTEEKCNLKTVYAIGSGAQFAFIKDGNIIRPVIVLTGADDLYGTATMEGTSLYRLIHGAYFGYVEIEEEDEGEEGIEYHLLTSRNLTVRKQAATLVYPRIKISSIKFKTDATFVLKNNNKQLEEYEDYSILSRDDSASASEIETNYYITLDPKVLLGAENNVFKIAYAISNADVSIYLDAVNVLKENSMPKTSYEVSINSINQKLIRTAYNSIGKIANINDTELKFKNVQGYISEVSLNLDSPQEDTITIKNYKTKFEDVFSSIVAETSAMQRNAVAIEFAANAFTTSGVMQANVIQDTLLKTDLDLAFNSGALTIDTANGIWARSEKGVVAMRGGGIFTASEQTADGKWIWNTGITPEGINANLITTGQLDTTKIRILSGTEVRFQWNTDGLFAYKSAAASTLKDGDDNDAVIEVDKINSSIVGVDYNTYVKFNEDGLFLTSRYDNTPVNRVEVSWEGFKLRNVSGEEVFFADADTGNLITAAGWIGGNEGWLIEPGKIRSVQTENGEANGQSYIELNAGTIDSENFQNNIKPFLYLNGKIDTKTLIIESGNNNLQLTADFIRLSNYRLENNTNGLSFVYYA